MWQFLLFQIFPPKGIIQQHSNKIRASEMLIVEPLVRKYIPLKMNFKLFHEAENLMVLNITVCEPSLWKKKAVQNNVRENIPAVFIRGKKVTVKEDNDLFFPMGWLMQPLNWMDYSFKEFVVKLSVNKEKSLTIQFITM